MLVAEQRIEGRTVAQALQGRAIANIVGVLAVGLGAFAFAQYPDPERYREAIDRYLASEVEAPPPKGAIVATGSSSMLFWRGRIEEDLAPLTVIPRGFGGSNMRDLRHFLAELVLRHAPRAVLIYEGDNDAAVGATPAQVLEHFDAIVATIHERLPGARIYILAVKPSVARWHLWDAMRTTNALFAARAEDDPLLTYIDIATPMLDDAGEPRQDIFVKDMLHMNAAGYDIWRDVVRPVLLAAEGAAERPAPSPR